MKRNTAINTDNLPAIEPHGEIEPMSEKLAPLIDKLPAIEPCDELEPMSEELAPIIADLPAIESYGEIEPMSEELARLIDNADKLCCDEPQPMTPELWRIIEKGLCPDRRRAATNMPQTHHKRRKPKQ